VTPQIPESVRAATVPSYDYLGMRNLNSHLRLPKGKMRLRPVQSGALHAVYHARGGLFPIGVGYGKTLIAVLSPVVLKCDLGIILAPAQTIEQMREMADDYALHYRSVPLEFVSYTKLSQPDGTDLLDRLIGDHDPSRVALIADEAHKLRRPTSARTKRFLRFCWERPQIAVVALSGTLTSRSLRDFSHLARITIGGYSPVPTYGEDLESWASCIDVDGAPSGEDWQRVGPLWTRYYPGAALSGDISHRKTALRKAFQSHLSYAPGVVATTAGALGCSLLIQRLPLTLPESVKHAMSRVRKGEPPEPGAIMHAEPGAALVHLSQGFYYVWDWPDGIVDELWLDARRRWMTALRQELSQNATQGYDSPFLVASKLTRDLDTGTCPSDLHATYADWCEYKDTPAPPSRAVWLDKFMIHDVAERLNADATPRIVWYQHRAMEDALAEIGLPVYGAGSRPPKVATHCAMSISAHGTGKNLQPWHDQLCVCPPASGQTWEQLLGRTHRPGQEADEVVFQVYQHTGSFRGAVNRSLGDARYVQAATGNQQKLLYGVWSG
jgi:hypothetical protein